MSVLVDTPIWSFALRRRASHRSTEAELHTREWTALVREKRVLLLGPVRQEVLSGIRDRLMFERLRLRLRDFDDEVLTTADFEEAARCGSRCRAAGIAGSATDFLLCAAALRRGAPIYTTDRDFAHYARHLSIELHHPRS